MARHPGTGGWLPGGRWIDAARALVLAAILTSGARADESHDASLATYKQFIARAEVMRERAGTRFTMAGKTYEHTLLAAVGEDGTLLGSRKGEAGPPRRDDPARPLSDWSPYTGPFGLAEAAHLYRRAVIGPTIPEMRGAASAGLSASVAALLTNRPLPAPPASWATEPLPDLTGWTQQMIDSLFQVYYARGDTLTMWWAQQIIDTDAGLTEAMTLFWHDHFATSNVKVVIPCSMYKQNQLLRQQALGNFKTLVQNIAIDPAMLYWLDGNLNRVGDVNENFARELLELFTMGVGNYTQDDVREAARAFTGWTAWDGWTTTFVPFYHDYGQKTFLGQTGAFSGPDIINIIFQQPETAEFLCRKLYRYFVDEYPDEALIQDLAQTLRDNNYEVKPVLSRLFSSQRFYDPNFRSALYADGIDRNFALYRSFDLAGVNLLDPLSNLTQITWWNMWICGQEPLAPPNVAGWPGYRSWVNSYTLPWRRTFNTALTFGYLWEIPLGTQVDALALAGALPDPNDPYHLVDDLSTCLYGQAPTQAVRTALLNALLQGMDPNQWELNMPGARNRILGMLTLFMRMPDFQLK